MTPDTTTLPALIAAAKPGDVITVPPGTYGSLTIKGRTFKPPITLKGGPGVLVNGILMQLCDGIGFDGLEVTVFPGQGAAIKGGCTNCTVSNCNLHGASVGDGGGISLINSPGAKVLGNDLHHLGGGVGLTNCGGSTVDGNTFHDLRIDGIDVVGGSQVKISNNHLTDFYPVPGDHSDAIQFITTNTVGPQTDILIENNTFVRGKGLAATQGIFMGNEAKVDYQRVTIRGNKLLGTIWHGILVSHADATVENNTVAGFDDAPFTPWIKLADGCTGHASGNITTSLQIVASPGFADAGNTLIKLIPPADHYTPPVDWPAVVADLKAQLAADVGLIHDLTDQLTAANAKLAAVRTDVA